MRLMGIIDVIQKARDRGAQDDTILQEIIEQNPNKQKSFQEALARGATATQILEELMRQNKASAPESRDVEIEKTAEEKRFIEAKKRVEALKQATQERERKVKTEQEKREKIPAVQEEEKPEAIPAPPPKAFTPPSPPSPSPPKPPAPAAPQKKSLFSPRESIRLLSKKPTIREKLWIRVLVFSTVLVLLATVATFWYWYLVIKKEPPVIVYPNGQNGNGDGNGDRNGDGNGERLPRISPSLIPVEATRTILISQPGELRDQLLQVIYEGQNIGQFTRVVIKNEPNDEILIIKDFFSALLIRTPEELYETIESDMTLFVYAQQEGPRIGLIVETIDPEVLTHILRTREPTLEDDFETFFSLVGKEGPALVEYFRDAVQVPGYRGQNFRYQTLSKSDLGIVYFIADRYFVLASSWESMRQTIERLAIEVPEVAITEELKRGDSGSRYQVRLLQMWLTENGVYPRGIVNGFFGPLTQEATIRFQEKYASEILAPQGLSRGTGIVDKLTRKKLNEQYGKSGIRPRLIELTARLQYGDRGDEIILLQTWLKKNPAVYPQGIVSGFFGRLTQASVIRFQEKYASNILVPQGLDRGSGIVDDLTIKKLNELYGEKI